MNLRCLAIYSDASPVAKFSKRCDAALWQGPELRASDNLSRCACLSWMSRGAGSHRHRAILVMARATRLMP